MILVALRKLKNYYTDLKYFLFLQKNSILRKGDKIYTHLTKEEKMLLSKLASNIRDGYALEIGSYLGASAFFIAAGLKGSSKLICIDTWTNIAMSEGMRDTYNEFVENTRDLQEKIIMIRGLSYEVIDKVKQITKEMDLLFIDGDHSYDGVKKDWDLYFPLVKKGGYVIFHDCGWADGVKRVVEEAKKYFIEYHQLPNMCWGIKK